MRAVTVIPGQPGSIALSELGTHDVLLKPATVVAKAWDHIERIGRRSTWTPRNVLITGAGPIGLLAGLITRQAPLAQWADADTGQPGDIKTILTF